MPTDAQSLLAASACYECQAPGELQLLKLGLLKQLVEATNAMADTSASALLAATRCYQCHPPGFWPLFELALLQMLAGTGVGGGGSSGVGAPTDPPASGNGTYLDTSNNSLWAWNPVTATWVQLIA